MRDWASRGAGAAAATSVTAIQDSTAVQDPLPGGRGSALGSRPALLRGPQGQLAPRPQSRQREGGGARGFRQKVEAPPTGFPAAGSRPAPSRPLRPLPGAPTSPRSGRGPSGSAPAPAWSPGPRAARTPSSAPLRSAVAELPKSPSGGAARPPEPDRVPASAHRSCVPVARRSQSAFGARAPGKLVGTLQRVPGLRPETNF